MSRIPGVVTSLLIGGRDGDVRPSCSGGSALPLKLAVREERRLSVSADNWFTENVCTCIAIFTGEPTKESVIDRYDARAVLKSSRVAAYAC